MPDCCVLETALSRRASLATFDDRLARTARGLAVEVTSGSAPSHHSINPKSVGFPPNSSNNPKVRW